MTPKQGNWLGPAPEARYSSLFATALAVHQPSEQLARAERKISEEAVRQNQVIEAQAIKTCFGLDKIGEIHEHGNQVFDQTTCAIMDTLEQSRSKEHHAIMEEFTRRQVDMFARQVFGAMDVGATNIGFEIHRSLYPPPEPPERRGLLTRMFG